MTNIDSLAPDQDDRVMAALSHVSALLPMIGVIAPIVIWVTQKGKSQYVAFQSLQAIAYQLSMVAAWFIGMGCYMCSFLGNIVTMSFTSSTRGSDYLSPIYGLGFIFPFIIIGLIFIGGFVFVIYGIVGAVMTFQGKPFRYALIGRRVEQFMQPRQD
jgi:uncharacterized Tic20 family protein